MAASKTHNSKKSSDTESSSEITSEFFISAIETLINKKTICSSAATEFSNALDKALAKPDGSADAIFAAGFLEIAATNGNDAWRDWALRKLWYLFDKDSSLVNDTAIITLVRIATTDEAYGVRKTAKSLLNQILDLSPDFAVLALKTAKPVALTGRFEPRCEALEIIGMIVGKYPRLADPALVEDLAQIATAPLSYSADFLSAPEQMRKNAHMRERTAAMKTLCLIVDKRADLAAGALTVAESILFEYDVDQELLAAALKTVGVIARQNPALISRDLTDRVTQLAILTRARYGNGVDYSDEVREEAQRTLDVIMDKRPQMISIVRDTAEKLQKEDGIYGKALERAKTLAATAEEKHPVNKDPLIIKNNLRRDAAVFAKYTAG